MTTTRPCQRVLIANRGEIALRLIRACQELGLETVQVYAEADRDSLPVRLADRAVCIGPAPATQSYLNVERIVSAALAYGADAIHPGYGFLAENAAFARLCEQAGIVFIGPPAAVIAAMGDKVQARRMAAAAQVPTIPGSPGSVDDMPTLTLVADGIGYPIVLKAVFGGGGHGMRVVRSAQELLSQYATAAREAKMAFGNGALYVERYFPQVCHIEVQVLADGDTVLHLGERDCSAQRRHQKLLEESPAPAVSAALRAQLGDAAVRLCQQVGYRSAGTVEYIFDPGGGQFYFMEMNTRLQVEHAVTESVTGIDIVKAQIRIAQGLPLELRQADVRRRGHALECRINAEDAEAGFAPCPGRVTSCTCREGLASGSIRISTAAIRYRPITTRCWPRSSPGDRTARRRWHACAGPWRRCGLRGLKPPSRCTRNFCLTSSSAVATSTPRSLKTSCWRHYDPALSRQTLSIASM